MIQIGEMHADVELKQRQQAARPEQPRPVESAAAMRDRLRPLVLEIMADEMERLRRRHG